MQNRRISPCQCWCILCLLLCGVLAGCSRPADPRGQRIAVRGQVTLNGEPLAEGKIQMTSSQGSGSIRASSMIHNGEFEFTADNGPLAGEARVEIYPRQIEMEELQAAMEGKESGYVHVWIPPHYNTESTLSATIQSGVPDQQLEFHLTSEE